MESVTWPRRHPTTEPSLATSQVKGARTIQPSEDEQVSNLADRQILLVPPRSHLADLVHLRLFRILIWHLFVGVAGFDLAEHGAVVEVLWLVCHQLSTHRPTHPSMQSRANKTFLRSRNTIINLFYIPGAFIGAFTSDWIGPRYCLAIGVFLQGILGFIMAGLYARLATSAHVAGFVVVYGYGLNPRVP